MRYGPWVEVGRQESMILQPHAFTTTFPTSEGTDKCDPHARTLSTYQFLSRDIAMDSHTNGYSPIENPFEDYMTHGDST